MPMPARGSISIFEEIPIMKSTLVLLSAAVFALALTGCHHTVAVSNPVPPAPPAPPAAPTASLTASPAVIDRGGSVQLSWNTQNASTVRIEGIGEVAATGSRQINPADSTTFHLTAKGSGGDAEASARVTVNTPAAKIAGPTEEELFARNMKDIFFSYDKADISTEEQSLVSADLQFLVQHPDVRIVIEGHCDERGSDEYNMGLGENRASTVRDALVKGGVQADRIKVVSLGKERPFCTAENEPCFSQNRRAHFVLKSLQQASNQ
jgi:peptidoglycan-associated lipoprotein